MCAFCKRGWHERYPVESTIEGRSYMELGVEWAEGRDMLTFGTIGGGFARFRVRFCPMCGHGLRGDAE